MGTIEQVAPGAASSSSVVAEHTGGEHGASSSSSVVAEHRAEEHDAVADAAAALDVVDVPATEFPEGTEFSADGTVSVTPFGTVRCSAPPHNGRQVGLVGVYRDGRRAFASCHLHPHCAVQPGIVTRPVSRLKLAEWLALGKPSKGLPAGERRRLGKQHRDLWKRD